MANEDRLKGKKILVVDDEPEVLETLEELLDESDVTKASTFEEARALLETEYFDIAILDIMGVAGYYLLGIANKKKVISLMLTAHALSPENIIRAYKEGAASYVPKDQMGNIPMFLNDILEAKEKGRHFWWRWLERISSAYWDKKFGAHWKDIDKEFWEKFGDWD